MNNKKCPNCGFINFLAAECCRKCETAFSAAGSPQPVYGGQGVAFDAYPRPFQATPPKSGFPVLKIFLYLLGGLIVAATLTGGGVAWLKSRSTVEWREFRPPQGGYAVMMPSEPKIREPLITPLANGSMINHSYTSTVMGQGSTLYCVVTFPGTIELTPEQIEKTLSEEINSMLAKINSTLVSKKSIVVTGNTGWEFEFRPPKNLEVKNARGFGKVFLMQNQEYLFLITAQEGSALLSDKDKFLTPVVY